MAIFNYEWVEHERYPDPVVHGTMAKLSIRIHGATVTSIYDRYAKQHQDYIVAPVSQIAEWIVTNWWYLLYEADTVPRNAGPDYAARHDLSYAGFGFVFPSLTLTPIGDRIQAIVKPWQPKHASLEFRARGDFLLHRNEVLAELASLLDAVITRLADTRASFDALAADWKAIRSLDAEEREFCQAAAMAGLDAFDLADDKSEEITRFWNEMPRSLREDALHGIGAAPPDGVRRWLARQLKAVEETDSGDGWRTIRNEVSRSDLRNDLPWRRGYANARAVRRALGTPSGPVRFDRTGSLRIGHRESLPPSRRIEGCVASRSPSCVVVRKPDKGRRFLLARALGDYIGRSESGPAILGTLNTARQAESRAFAAEFLAPAESLRERVGNARAVDSQAVDELADEMKVSSWVVRHQVTNHAIAEVEDPLWPTPPAPPPEPPGGHGPP